MGHCLKPFRAESLRPRVEYIRKVLHYDQEGAQDPGLCISEWVPFGTCPWVDLPSPPCTREWHSVVLFSGIIWLSVPKTFLFIISGNFSSLNANRTHDSLTWYLKLVKVGTQNMSHTCSFLHKFLMTPILFSYCHQLEFCLWTICIRWLLHLTELVIQIMVIKTWYILSPMASVTHLWGPKCCLHRILANALEKELWLDWVLSSWPSVIFGQPFQS